MLVLTGSPDSFPDHSDPAVRYRVPTGLAPAAGPDGTPQVTLSRGEGSGLFQLRLVPVWPALAAGERPVSFSAGRFRLLMTTPAATEHGEWRPTPVAGDAVVDRAVSLSAAEAAMARRLGASGGEVVEIEVELELTGFAPTYSWLVECDGELLRRSLAALLGETPAAWDKVEAAFLGLSRDLFAWHPLSPAALPPPTDAALRAIAHHARPFLLEAVAGGWQVRGSAPARLALSLAVPRLSSMTIGMRWSFSAFLAAQPDPKRHVIDIAIPAPLQAATLLVVNDVPLAAGGIERIDVEVRTGGPSGSVHCTFLPGQPAASRLSFVRETYQDLDLSWRARLTVATVHGPTVVETPPAKSGLTVELSSANVGVIPLHFHAEPEVFAYAASLEIAVGSRTLALTQANPDAWAVGRTPPATCPVVAVTQSGQRTALGDFAIDGGLTIGPAALGAGEPASVVFRPPANLPDRAAYLALQIENGPWRSLDSGATLEWHVRRGSRLDPLAVRYRTRHVPRLASGATAPIAESAWKTAASASVEVEL